MTRPEVRGDNDDSIPLPPDVLEVKCVGLEAEVKNQQLWSNIQQQLKEFQAYHLARQASTPHSMSSGSVVSPSPMSMKSDTPSSLNRMSQNSQSSTNVWWVWIENEVNRYWLSVQNVIERWLYLPLQQYVNVSVDLYIVIKGVNGIVIILQLSTTTTTTASTTASTTTTTSTSTATTTTTPSWRMNHSSFLYSSS